MASLGWSAISANSFVVITINKIFKQFLCLIDTHLFLSPAYFSPKSILKLEALGEHKSSLGECTQRAQTSAKAMDRHQNLMARYLYHPQSFLKISSKSIHKFSSNKLTDRQTGHRSLPKFNGLLLVASSIFPKNFIEIPS